MERTDDAPFLIRDARADDVPALVRLWFEGWHDAHAAILPEAWSRARTLDSFVPRLHDGLDGTRVAASADGALFGFAMVRRGGELDQFFVARAARGGGVAPALMADALDRIGAAGNEVAWLACAVGNTRAARFYEKQGWRRAGVIPREAQTSEGSIRADVWRYEIDLRERAPRSDEEI